MSQNTTAMQRGAGGETTGATDMTTQQPEALTYERDRAIMQGERNASLTAFDHDGRLTLAEERLYEAAFTNGWDRHAAVVAPQTAPMSPANRLIAYSAATRLRELGFEWDATAEAWLQRAAASSTGSACAIEATTLSRTKPLRNNYDRIYT